MSDMSSYLGDKLLNWLKGTSFGTAPHQRLRGAVER